MKKNFAFCIVTIICLTAKSLFAEEINIQKLNERIEHQEQIINAQQKTIDLLLKRVNELESKMEDTSASSSPNPSQRVELKDQTPVYPSPPPEEHVLAKPWYENIQISGFGAAGFIGTGGNGHKQHGSFLNYEATLNIDAKVWEDIHYFHELQTIRLGDENTQTIRTGESYLHFKDIAKTLFNKSNSSLGIKLGRMDIPFGEDYLVQDAPANPLITLPAAFPNWFDEGIIVHGDYKGIGCIFSVMDGNNTRASDDNNDKSVSLKLFGNPFERLYLSGSIFRNGESPQAALRLGGSQIVPVGTGNFPSTAGSSGSGTVDTMAYEFDAKYLVGEDRYLKSQFGHLWIDDDNDIFDRDIYYFQLEPKWNLGPRFENKWYLVGRLSAISTFNDKKGYLFDGHPFAQGDTAFGYDTKALYRYALGIGYKPNPRTLIKSEYSLDDFRLINNSAKEGGTQGREFYGIVAAVEF